jgi:hypothetical protein
LTTALEDRAPPDGRLGPRRGPRGQFALLVLSLDPGEYVLVTERVKWKTAQSSAIYWARQMGWKVTTRRTDEGLEIWRVKEG